MSTIRLLVIIIGFLVFLVVLRSPAQALPSQYVIQRNEFIREENSKMTGWDIVLNEKEKAVNKTLMNLKEIEFKTSMLNNNFPPSMTFLTSRTDIQASQVFDIIKMMPKGAALHIHEISLSSIEWVVKNLTYLPDLYFCTVRYPEPQRPTSLHFKFSRKPPGPVLPLYCDPWKQVADARKGNEEKFDEMLIQNLSMRVPDPLEAYPSGNASWIKFEAVLSPIMDLFFSSSAFDKYLYQAFQEFDEDNVQYLEIRTVLEQIEDINGYKHDQLYTMKKFHDFIQEYKNKHPSFFGARIIFTCLRNVDRAVVKQAISLAMEMMIKFPQTMIGFDLVGEENLGHPIFYFINELLIPSNKNVTLPYFFHAGETDWQGTSVDDNLVDAVLLNASRIGHGFSILKHPLVMEDIKKRGIAIELNPISNQVLKLVDDLRNHPGAFLLANDFPVVISSDDPAPWGAKGLSYDFYEAFMAFGGKTADLRTLKKLALNSIEYCALPDSEKMNLKEEWQIRWNKFLDHVLAKHQIYTD